MTGAMEMDMSSLFAGFFFGVFGVYFIKRGKDLGNIPKILVGLAMVAFTYFVPSPWCWVVGVVLMVAGFKI
jgi:hypothetical protein